MPRWKNGPMKCDHAGPLAKVRSRLTSTCSARSAPAVTYSRHAEDVEPVELAVGLAQELVVADRVVAQLQQVGEAEHRPARLLQSDRGRSTAMRLRTSAPLEW